MILVVGLNEILNDGARLPQRDTRVGVLNGWDATIGVDLDEWLLLESGHVLVDLYQGE